MNKVQNEAGRSMVEILGVLAIIGVLSFGGIAGYTLSWNKYKANKILEEFNQRAHIVSSQIMSENQPSLSEFERLIGDSVFDNTVYDEYGDAQWTKIDKKFSLKVGSVSKEVCQALQNMISDIVKGFEPLVCEDNTTVVLSFNNDLSTVHVASDYKTEESCNQTPYKWCSGTNRCVESNCCLRHNEQCCDPDTGDITSYEFKTCNYKGGEDNGMCLNGECVERLDGKSCNVNNYSGNKDCGGVKSGYYCYYSTAKCQAMTSDQQVLGKLQTDSRPGRGTDWYTAMNFCHALGKKLPSFNDVAIKLPAKKTQCHLSDCLDGGAAEPAVCNTSTTLADLRSRFDNDSNAIWVSNSDGSYSFVLDLGANYAGYVYRNHKTSPLGLAVCE